MQVAASMRWWAWNLVLRLSVSNLLGLPSAQRPVDATYGKLMDNSVDLHRVPVDDLVGVLLLRYSVVSGSDIAAYTKLERQEAGRRVATELTISSAS